MCQEVRDSLMTGSVPCTLKELELHWSTLCVFSPLDVITCHNRILKYFYIVVPCVTVVPLGLNNLGETLVG